MRIYKLTKMNLPKIAVLATGLAAAALVATMSPQAARCDPSRLNCAGCHGLHLGGDDGDTEHHHPGGRRHLHRCDHPRGKPDRR